MSLSTSIADADKPTHGPDWVPSSIVPVLEHCGLSGPARMAARRRVVERRAWPRNALQKGPTTRPLLSFDPIIRSAMHACRVAVHYLVAGASCDTNE
jgi:hypothetical protein